MIHHKDWHRIRSISGFVDICWNRDIQILLLQQFCLLLLFPCKNGNTLVHFWVNLSESHKLQSWYTDDHQKEKISKQYSRTWIRIIKMLFCLIPCLTCFSCSSLVNYSIPSMTPFFCISFSDLPLILFLAIAFKLFGAGPTGCLALQHALLRHGKAGDSMLEHSSEQTQRVFRLFGHFGSKMCI